MSELAGIVAAVVFPLVWMVQRYRLYESVGPLEVETRYVLLYVVGSLLLTYYAFTVRDLPLVLFSVTMTMFTATEYVLLLLVRRKHGA